MSRLRNVNPLSQFPNELPQGAQNHHTNNRMNPKMMPVRQQRKQTQQQQQQQRHYKRHNHRRNASKSMIALPFLVFTLLIFGRSADAFSPLPSSPGGAAPRHLLTRTPPRPNARRRSSNSNSNPDIAIGVRQPTSRASASSLNASPAATFAAAKAVSGAISGGLFAGGLHAVAGPDHLAALLPRCCGQTWWRAGTVGAVWGLGHGISAVAIGAIAFFAKQRSAAAKSLLAINSITELAVGVSLIIIGLLGIKEAREWTTTENDETDLASSPAKSKSLSAAAVSTTTGETAASPPVVLRTRAILFNGLLHGCSWDGAPSLAPSLALATWGGNLAFLSAYAAGTMVTMAVVTMLIGEVTRRAGRVFPNIPRRISFGSSIMAIAIGVVWCYLGIKAM